MALHTVKRIQTQDQSCKLGTLYDAQKNTFISAFTLWDPETLLERTENRIFKNASDIREFDSLTQMFSQLRVDHSKIYEDQIDVSHEQKNITLMYTANICKRVLWNVGETTLTQQADKTMSLATHVVTGIIGTANTSFEFSSETLDERGIQNIKGTMKSVIKKIPSFIHGKEVDIKLSHQEKTLTHRFTCKFYGDFILERIPATFEDAVKTFTQLPKLVEENKFNCVPQEVEVTPLVYLLPDPDVRSVTQRRDMMWFACDLTLDPNTANFNLILEGKLATHGDRQEYPDHAGRFVKVPQVLCKERLDQRCYWEVEMKAAVGGYVAAGVCYKQLERGEENFSCLLGFNNVSWCIDYKPEERSGEIRYSFSSKHDWETKHHTPPSSIPPQLGVFLNVPEGTLSFYEVSGDMLSHLHTFKKRFSNPVYPAFKVCNNSSVRLLI